MDYDAEMAKRRKERPFMMLGCYAIRGVFLILVVYLFWLAYHA